MTELIPEDQLDELLEEHDPEDLKDHLDQVSETISDFTDDTRAGNLVYAQKHVLQKAVDLLREEYEDADEYGEHEAEMIATAIILSKETENEVW